MLKNIFLFGATGFLGTQLKKNLSGNIVPISLREKDWHNNLPKDANVFVNCIGKAHDHKGTATEHDFYFANYELVKVLFEEFLKSSAQLFIHISSIAAVEENERTEVLTENSVGNPQSHYGKSKKAAEEYKLCFGQAGKGYSQADGAANNHSQYHFGQATALFGSIVERHIWLT